MVIRARQLIRTHQGMLTTDLVVAMGILALAIIPLSFSLLKEEKLCRVYYLRSVAMEITDGEMEKLSAGEWRQYQQGRQPYAVKAEAAKQLQGNFMLDVRSNVIRLEFEPAGRDNGGHVVREVKLP